MARGARKEGFSRRHRFVGRGSFAAALHSPRKHRGATCVIHVAAGVTGQSRFGLSLAKRVARSATDRNRMKRIAREVFRRHGVKFAGLDLVVTPRMPCARGGEAEWIAELASLLDRAAQER